MEHLYWTLLNFRAKIHFTVASFQLEHYLAAGCLAFLAACLPGLVSLLALPSRPLPFEGPDPTQHI